MASFPQSLDKYTSFGVRSRLRDVKTSESPHYLTVEDCEKLSRTPELAFSEAFKNYFAQHPLFFTEGVLRGLCYSYLALWDQVSDENFSWLKEQTSQRYKFLTRDSTHTELVVFLQRYNEVFDFQSWKALFDEALEDKQSFLAKIEKYLSLGDIKLSRFYQDLSSKLLWEYTESLAHDESSIMYLRERSARTRLIKDLLPYANVPRSVDFLCVSGELARSKKLYPFVSDLAQSLKEGSHPGDPRLETFANFWKQAPEKLVKTLRKWQRQVDLVDLVKENFPAHDPKDIESLCHFIMASKNPRVLLTNLNEVRANGGILGSVYLFRNGHNFSGHLENPSDDFEMVILFQRADYTYAFSNQFQKPMLRWEEKKSPAMKEKYWAKQLSWTELLKTKPTRVSFLPKTLHQVFGSEN